jgi:four helix bundle protein
MLSHEKLDVYRLAIQFVALARKIIRAIPRGNGDLVDQLRRASHSVPLLIAEGVGKTTAAHQRRYFSDARGSALESAACLDVLQEEGLITAELWGQGKALLERQVAMLTKMCK